MTGSRLAKYRRAVLMGLVASAFMVWPHGTVSARAVQAVPSLRVAIPVVDTPFADIYTAQAKGYFKKARVNVTITPAGSTTLTLLTSRQADLAMFGTGQALIPVANGLAVKIIYNFLGAGNAATVAVSAHSSVKSLMDLSGKRVGVLGVGGSSYGYGEIFSKYVNKHGGSAFDIIPQTSAAALIDSLVSGQIDAVVGTGSWFAQAIRQGEVKLLIDSTRKSDKKWIGGAYAEASIFGLAKTIDAKHEAIVRFLEAVSEADAYLRKAKISAIVTELKSLSDFGPAAASDLTDSATYNKHFWAPTKGVISKKMWNNSLKHYAAWNLPGFDRSNSLFSYGRRVDMSFLTTATKRLQKAAHAH